MLRSFSSGMPADILPRQDFLLYDQGKLQTISNFSVETAQARLQRAAAVAKTQADASPTGDGSGTKPPVLPERFVPLVFDDTPLPLQDATFPRSHARRLHLSTR